MVEKYLKGATNPAVVFNSTFQIIACNEYFKDAFGEPTRLKNILTDFISKKDHPKLFEAYQKWQTPPSAVPFFIQCLMKLQTDVLEECQLTIQPNEDRTFVVNFQAVAANTRVPIHKNGFFDGMREICFRIDLDGTVKDINEAALDILGYATIDNIIGQNILASVNTDVDALTATDLWRILKEGDGKTAGYETHFTKSDGETILLASNIRYYYNENLRIAGIEGFATDITDYTTVVNELKKALNFTKSLLQSIPVPLMYKDKNLVFEGCNNSFTDLIGVSSEDIQGKTADEVWPDGFAAISEQKEREALKGKNFQILEGQITGKDDEPLSIIMVTAAYFGDDGEPAGVISSFLDLTARRAVELAIKKQEQSLLTDTRRFAKIINPGLRKSPMVGTSDAISKLYDDILMAAGTNVPVLIEGESGTGKELVAHEIHRNSDRAGKKIVTVNCSAIPNHLTESTLFGHVKGSFTGALDNNPGHIKSADKSTLFLDEINSIPLEKQAKLLRALDSFEVTPVGGNQAERIDFRLITASNQDLAKLTETGQIRADFFYRLTVLTIKVPPLRERKEDIPMLSYHFLTQYKQEHSGAKSYPAANKVLTKELFSKLYAYDFPGNIRELRNILFQYFTTGELLFLNFAPDPKPVQQEHPAVEIEPVTEPEPVIYDEDSSLKDVVARVEKDYIQKLLDKYRYNQTRVAKHLQVSRKTLYNKMAVYGLK